MSSTAKRPAPKRAAAKSGKSSKSGRTKQKQVIISDAQYGLPYSKGLMARSVMAAGISPGDAYTIAMNIESFLHEQKIYSLSAEELRAITYDMLESQLGEDAAEKYLRWQALAQLDKPLIILFGGTTGVGKSTIASEVAHRLNITRIVATDTIREVMRALFSVELMPSLYKSSYDAWESLHVPLPEMADPVTIGFIEQTKSVMVGIKATIDRAIKEGQNMVMEGVHLVPGFYNFDYEHAFVIPIIVSVDDEELHRSHFYLREIETDGFRAYERYKANFPQIRRVGSYIDQLALQHGIPIIRSVQLDEAVAQTMKEISNRVIFPAEAPGVSIQQERAGQI